VKEAKGEPVEEPVRWGERTLMEQGHLRAKGAKPRQKTKRMTPTSCDDVAS